MPQTIHDLLSHSSAFQLRPSLSDESGRQISQRDLQHYLHIAAHNLRAREIEATDRVGIALPPGYEFSLVILCATCSEICVLFDCNAPPRQLTDDIDRLGCSAIVANPDFEGVPAKLQRLTLIERDARRIRGSGVHPDEPVS
jgi:non-ribosomal peptide synthetase component F